MPSSWLDLLWPIAGIDRSISYQKQPPFTCPDALNVRTEDMSEYRERGGSRPGLGLSLRTQLAGPVRWLGKVSVLKVDWPTGYSPIFGGSLNGGLTSVPWSGSPVYAAPLSSQQGLDASLVGTAWAIALPSSIYSSRDAALPYSVSFFLRPPVGDSVNSVAKIHVFLVSPTENPANSSIQCSILFGPTSYQGFLREVVGGTILQSVESVVHTDDVGMPGSMMVKITPALKKAELFWRRHSLGLMIKGVVAGHFSAFESSSANGTLQATKLTTDFGINTSQAQSFRSQRRDLLVAISEGHIYLEDSTDTLVPKVLNAVNPVGELTAIDREQKLFIADYGAAMHSDGTGSIATPYNVLNDPGKNFTSLGIGTDYILELLDSDYSQNEVQTVELINTNGGNYRLGFRGAFTTPLSQGAAGSSVGTALVALSTIGTGNVLVTGNAGGPHTVTFQGDLAGEDVELLSYQADSLTCTAPGCTGVPAMSIVSTRLGAGGEFVRGSYPISSVSGSNITFAPAISVYSGFVAPIGSVSYQVVRAPKIFNPKTGLVTIHTASKGFVPAGCRLVCLYRDRIVYAAGDLAPHVWFMSRQGDPFDWDYSQEDSGSAIFAQASVGGALADPITALIPHSDECLVFGCYNSLWMLRGDPGYGGSLDQLSRKIGIVAAHAWCRTPDDMLVFLSPDGLYVMPAGCAGFPTSLSRERMPNELLGMTPEREVISMEYDTVHRGIHLFATKHDSSQASHWWFDWEAKSFWRVRLQSAHEPLSVHERIAWDDVPVVLIGGRDGYIRAFHRDNQFDDQDHPIESYCVLGPFHLDRQGYMEGLLTDLVATLGAESGSVDWEVMVGDSPERCLRNPVRDSGNWPNPGMNHHIRPMARGVAAAVKVSAGSANRRWFLERLTAVVRAAGERRVR